MVKLITGILIGVAVSEGAIKSVDDKRKTYVSGFKGTEYGGTPIRDLLHMSSGVDFGDARDGSRDLNRLWRDMVLGLGITTRGMVSSIAQFNQRIAPPGTTYLLRQHRARCNWRYSSVGVLALGAKELLDEMGVRTVNLDTATVGAVGVKPTWPRGRTTLCLGSAAG
jgi:CubicO group peptidase (beta-lactamase class C family)